MKQIFLVLLHILFSVVIQSNSSADEICIDQNICSSSTINQEKIISDIPIISLKIESEDDESRIINQIGLACSEIGFFYISDHSIPTEIIENLKVLSERFFQLPIEKKTQIAMSKKGKAWRGYFKVGDEVTSGIPDEKEGIVANLGK